MLWLWVPLGLVTLIIVAAFAEAYVRRNEKRPLSRHALNKRRWDDKNYEEDGTRDDHVIHIKGMPDSRTGARQSTTWSVPKDPNEQAGVLMPREDKGK